MDYTSDVYAGTSIPLCLLWSPPNREEEFIKKAIPGTIEDYEELCKMMESVPGNTYCLSFWHDRPWTLFEFKRFKNTMSKLVYDCNKRDYLNEAAVRHSQMEKAKRRMPMGRKNRVFYSCIAFSPSRSWMTGTPRK